MKLVYIWIEKYRGRIEKQGIQLARDYIVEPKENMEVHITDNRDNSAKDFYGQNVSSVTAFVGENGAGKTTLSRMIIDMIPSVLDRKKNDNQIFENLGMNDWLDEFFGWILYKKDGEWCYYESGIDEEITFSYNEETVTVPEVNIDKEDLMGIYITNVFNSGDFFLSELDLLDQYTRQNDFPIQMTYSPVTLLNRLSKTQKDAYGGRNFLSSKKYSAVYQEYAQLQGESIFRAYSIQQERFFLEGCYIIPKELQESFHFFSGYSLEVVDCSEYIKNCIPTQPNENAEEMFFLSKQMLGYMKSCNSVNDIRKIKDLLFANLLFELSLILEEKWENIKEYLEGEIDDQTYRTLYEIVEKRKEELKAEETEVPALDEHLRVINMLINKELDILGEDDQKHFFKMKGDKSDDGQLMEKLIDEFKREDSFVARNIRIIHPPVSSGEIAIVNLFGYLSDSLKYYTGINANKRKSKKDMIIVIDEIDSYLHPRWQQEVLTSIFEFINGLKGINAQIVITSHSPIVLSDILKDDVYKLRYNIEEKDGQEIIQIKVEKQSKRTFGAEITELYHDSFFLNEGNIGEFAKKKINTALKNLTMDGEKSTGCDFMSQRELDYLIDNIGFEPARRRMRKMYDDFFTKKEERRKSIMEQIKSLPEDEKVRLMKELREEESTND